MYKKIKILLLSLVILFLFVPVKVSAGEIASGTCGENLTWTLSDEGVLTISGTGEMTRFGGWDSSKIISIVIEEGVTNIPEQAYWGYENLTNISIPDSVTDIGNYAFHNCSSLTNISIPGSVAKIGDYAFENCDSLTNVNILKGVTTIGQSAFWGCGSLTSVSISEGVTTIGAGAFEGCSSLTNISIPDSVTIIGGAAFAWCSSLTNVSIPDSVTTIGGSAFFACESLTNVSIPEGVTYIGTYTFAGCSSLTNVSIPDSVTAIWSYAFENCSSLTNVSIPDSVTIIDGDAFWGCSGLNKIIFYGNTPEMWYENNDGDIVYLEVFTGVTATAYYPANAPTWTEDVRCDYGGTITWVGYNEGETPWDDSTGEQEPGEDDTLKDLTELDYLAFSKICYEDFDDREGDSIQEVLNDKGMWDKSFEDSDIKYSELCANIANWKVADIWDFSDSNADHFTGFYGVAFVNSSESDAVIAYRGSEDISKIFKDEDAFEDWIVNDFPNIVLNIIIEDKQYMDAITMYESVAYYYPNVAVTGHSLGGGLANIVSAYSGCKGVSMNAISILDAVYAYAPELYAESFSGVDKWNFIDHANQYDIVAGAFEHYYSTHMKPVVAYKSNIDVDFVGIIPTNVDHAFRCHGLSSYVTKDANGNVRMQDKAYTFEPNDVISNYMTGKFRHIDFGTSDSNRIDKGLAFLSARTSYGGDGLDTINTNIWADTLIGGRGYDDLDGSRGDDTYIYCKGDGVDTIHDIGGNDELYLLGFDEEDTISVLKENGEDYIDVRCNGETIVKISKKNREYVLVSLDSFKIIVNSGVDYIEPEVYDISDAFYKFTYDTHLYIGCPVNVEILDSSDNVVYILKDGEVGNHYTDYGNFYVFEEEDGEFGKLLDLIEGYSVRIMGVKVGTMDITYQVPVNGELTNPVSVADVPVNDSLVATLEENAEGEVYLVVDEDGDGKNDVIRQLYAQNTFSDVSEDAFYYEPVQWAVTNNITNGYGSDTIFNPDGTCTRGQIVTFLWRANGSPEPTSMNNPFTDVPSNEYYYKAVLWAVENGITAGYGSDTIFNPEGACTRGQVATFLWRAEGKPAMNGAANPFTDVKAGEFYYDAVLWAVENGITNGYGSDTIFNPDGVCTRGQIVTFLYRAMQ